MAEWHLLKTTFDKLVKFAEMQGWRVEDQPGINWAETKTFYSSQGAAVVVFYNNQLLAKNIFGFDLMIENFKC